LVVAHSALPLVIQATGKVYKVRGFFGGRKGIG
jgi:hypothetical protein